MNEQKLNEAAEKYADEQCDIFCMIWSEEELAINKANSETDFKAGARWHEQQNPWRKVEDELPEVTKYSGSHIGCEDNVKLSSRELIAIQNGEKFIAFFCHGFDYWGYPYSDFLDQDGSHIFNVTEWKYIDND